MSEQQQQTTVIPPWTLGWRLKRALDWADVSVQQMADELGYDRSTISRWMNDRGQAPRTSAVKQWAFRCGVPWTWLTEGNEGSGPKAPAPNSPDDPKVTWAYLADVVNIRRPQPMRPHIREAASKYPDHREFVHKTVETGIPAWQFEHLAGYGG